MSLPEATNLIWSDILLEHKQIDFKFFAAKIFIGNAKLIYKDDPTPQNLQKLTKELRELFAKNLNLPTVQEDLKKFYK
ncbi:MAG: hypothetical protein HQK49_04935 [Oligoflexia bacterium]|nr:hypothetical protein [Oligoflexia bacterium]